MIVDSPSCVCVIQATATNSEADAFAWQPTAKLQCTPTLHCPHCSTVSTVPSACCRLHAAKSHAAPQQGQLAVAAWLFQMKFCGFSGLELCAVRSALRLLALNVAHFSHGARQTHNNKNNVLLSLSLSCWQFMPAVPLKRRQCPGREA